MVAGAHRLVGRVYRLASRELTGAERAVALMGGQH